MKVYALREQQPAISYMPVLGYHSSLVSAKEQAKELFNRTAEWDVALYEIQGTVTHADWIDLLNADSITSTYTGRCPRDFLIFVKIAFESAAMKRHRKELRNAVDSIIK